MSTHCTAGAAVAADATVRLAAYLGQLANFLAIRLRSRYNFEFRPFYALAMQITGNIVQRHGLVCRLAFTFIPIKYQTSILLTIKPLLLILLINNNLLHSDKITT